MFGSNQGVWNAGLCFQCRMYEWFIMCWLRFVFHLPIFLSFCLSFSLSFCLVVYLSFCFSSSLYMGGRPVLLGSFCVFLDDGEQKVDVLDVMVIIGQWSSKSTFGANNCKYLLDNKWLFVTTSENRWNIYKYYHHFCDAGYCGAQY